MACRMASTNDELPDDGDENGHGHKRATLLDTNPYARDKESLLRNVLSSSRVEGIDVDIEVES